MNAVFTIPDINSDFEDVPFTDGTGNISSALAKMINEHFRLQYCVAYQIRLAGYKGVLMLKQEGMEGHVEVRPSMCKFEGKEFDLGIIRCATYSVAYLNRQIIMLLCGLEVPDTIFMEKLEASIKLLDKKVTHRNLLKQIRSAMDHP